MSDFVGGGGGGRGMGVIFVVAQNIYSKLMMNKKKLSKRKTPPRPLQTFFFDAKGTIVNICD